MNEPRRYRINEVLGRGSFGVVYRAEMLGSGGFAKPVALKVLRGSFDPAAEIEQRLRDEARLLGMLRHPSVVHVDGLARLPDGWAVVMEYIPGVDAGVLIRRGPLPPRVAVEIAEEVASALYSAFALPSPLTDQPLHLVHRDLKPGNLRITAHGEVKILDFGAARAEVGEREASTQAWRFGTPKYMAPERHDGLEGPEGDIYGLGIVLAQLLTGEKAPDPPTNPDRHLVFVEEIVGAVRTRLRGTLESRGITSADTVSELIGEMIAFEPASRPTAREVQQRLRAMANEVMGPTLRAWSESEIPLILSFQPPLTRDERCGEIIIEESQGQPTLAGTRGTGGAPAVVDATATFSSGTPWSAVARGLLLGLGAIVLLTLVFFAALRPSLVDNLLSAFGGPTPETPAPPAPRPEALVASAPPLAPPPNAEKAAPAPEAAPSQATTPASRHGGGGTAAAAPEVVSIPAEPAPSQVRIAAPEVSGPEPAHFVVNARNPPAEIWAQGDKGGRYAPGDLPGGTYTLYVRFTADQDAIPAVTFTVGAGDTASLSCDASLSLCRRTR